MESNLKNLKKPTLGLALSGSGNRTTFYIGFLEVFQEAGIEINYMSACSGGSLVAAAYSCGTLEELKKFIFSMGKKDFLEMATRKRGKGGLYSLDPLEELFYEKFTKGKHFEEVKPLMSFTSVDVENGEIVDLCMGDIAKAARISCTLPGIFEPSQWGNRTLIDGGILMLLPTEPLKNYGADVIVGISTGGTRHIFSKGILSFKKMLNFFTKSELIKEIKEIIEGFNNENKADEPYEMPNLFTTLGRSMDLAIKANAEMENTESACDLIIKMKIPKVNKLDISQDNLKKYYELGRSSALENLPKIKELTKQLS